jgi:DNA-binding NarL/FixJ family response regulator/anti-anti-sigma regulatory factor
MRIVVVDDTDLIRGLLRAVLTDAGHDVIGEAANGMTGVQATVALTPDLVIMDWNMPGMNGVDATRRIRARCPGVEVVAYSSAADATVRHAFLQAGAVRYVDKGDIDHLLAAVRELAEADTTAVAARAAPPLAEPDVATLGPPPQAGFELHTRSWPALLTTHIAVKGALEGRGSDRLCEAIAECSRPRSRIVLDLSELTALDDAGVAAIHRCHELARAREAEIEIHDPSPTARRALRRHRVG